MRILVRTLLLVLLSVTPWDVHGFSVHRRSVWRSTRPLLAARDDAASSSSSSSSSDGERHRRDARCDVRNLLTQRAIQSLMFLLEECRDPHSGRWIENFLGTCNQLEYHGLGAAYMERFGGTWDAPLLKMVERPKEVVVIRAKRRGRGHGGWSKDNPYLEERFHEVELDIDPVSLASRILAVREQIAGEWAHDLEIVEEANSQILESYFKRVKEEREKSNSTQTVAFERTGVNILSNHTAFQSGSSSPFRKGNFDLLYNLCTQASIHRLLHQLSEAGEAKEVSFEWLLKFYKSRVADYFDGDQKYGRADDFLEELLLTSPSVVMGDDGKAGLADPLGLAEHIIETRSDIAKEWKEVMENIQADHAEIRKVILSKQMDAWSSPTSTEGAAFE